MQRVARVVLRAWGFVVLPWVVGKSRLKTDPDLEWTVASLLVSLVDIEVEVLPHVVVIDGSLAQSDSPLLAESVPRLPDVVIFVGDLVLGSLGVATDELGL